MRRFDGRVALVTGAASGMGRATAIKLGSEGARIYALDVNEAALAETAGLVKDAGGEVQTARCDVADRDACFAATAACVAAYGRLDVLCNIAGVLRFARTHEMSPEDYHFVMNVNVGGVFWMSQAAIPHLLESHGNIVNIASNAGLMGQAYTSVYCASKAAVVNLTKSMAWEYMKDPIRINAIAPSGTVTNLIRDVNMPEGLDQDLMSRYFGKREMTQPEEVAETLAYMASDEAKSVHGAIWTVDNAITAG